MRYANWLVATAIGASLSLSSASGWAQLKTGAKKEAGVPKGKALGVPDDLDVPKGKAFGLKEDVPQRREARRIPVIDANANATFRSTQLIGMNITDADRRMIGEVVDFVSDAHGNLLYPIVSYSGSAGFTGKLFAIPPTGLSFTAGENNATTAQFAFDPQLLKNAPSFSSTRFPDFSDQAFVNELKAFYADLLPSTANPRAAATDPTVPANGPGDRVPTREQTGAPTLPADPTLPANGPGDRPATVNPALPRTGTQPGTTTPGARIPGTTGTENAGFPAASGTTRAGTSGAAGTGTDLSTPITSSRASAATKSDSSIVGKTGSPASSGIPGGTVVGRTGSPASESVRSSAAGDVRTGVEAEGTAANNRMMLRSSQMLGMSIQDNKGQLLGKVIDSVSDTAGNRQFAIASLTGDDRMIILPIHALHFQAGARGSNFATLRVAPGQLKKAPSFTGDVWPDFTNQEFMTNLQKFWEPLLPVQPTNVGVTTPGGSTTTSGGTRTPPWPSRPIPPGGPVPRPGPDGQFPPATPEPLPNGSPTRTTGSTTPTGPTTPGGSRSTPGGTRTPDFPSRPIPPGGPVPSNPAPRPGAPRLPAPGAPAPGVPGIPALPGGAGSGAPAPGGGAPGGGAAPAGGGAPSGGGTSGGSGAGASGT